MRTILCEADSAQNCNCRLCEAESALAAAVEMVLKDTRGLGLDCDPEGFNEVQHYYVRHHEGDVISSSPDLLTACVKALKGGGE